MPTITLPAIYPMDERIRKMLQALSGHRFGDFIVEGALIFLHDEFSESLEPAFNSFDHDQIPRDFVLATSSPSKSLEDNIGLATIAFSEQKAYSREPLRDGRLSAKASQFLTSFGINGSLMAVRLSAQGTAVALVYANDILALSAAAEGAALQAFASFSSQLETALLQRQVSKVQQDFDRYSRLAAFFQSMPRGLTIEQACGIIISQMPAICAAENVYLRIAELNGTGKWYPSLNDDQMEILDSLCTWKGEESGVAINRLSVSGCPNPQLANFGPNLAWCRITVQMDTSRLNCIMARKADSVSNHWTRNDIELATRAVELFALQLQRARRFDDILERIVNPPSQQSPPQFSVWCQLLFDYFGVDQVLIAQVSRDAHEYTVETRFLNGFQILRKSSQTPEKSYGLNWVNRQRRRTLCCTYCPKISGPTVINQGSILAIATIQSVLSLALTQS